MIHYTITQSIMNRLFKTKAVLDSERKEIQDTVVAGMPSLKKEIVISNYSVSKGHKGPTQSGKLSGENFTAVKPTDDTLTSTTTNISFDITPKNFDTEMPHPVGYDTIDVANKTITLTFNKANDSDYTAAVTAIEQLQQELDNFYETKIAAITSQAIYGPKQVIEESKTEWTINFNTCTSREGTEYYASTNSPATASELSVKVKRITETLSKTMKLTFQKIVYEQQETLAPFFPNTAYIGLFTQMPGPDGTGFIEPTHANKDPLSTYRRMNLHVGLLKGEYVMNDAQKCTTDAQYLGQGQINNKDIIMFPEALTQKQNSDGSIEIVEYSSVKNEGLGWGTIVGFGIFENKEPAGPTEYPYFWGRVNEPVLAYSGSVPLFRAGEFNVFLA